MIADQLVRDKDAVRGRRVRVSALPYLSIHNMFADSETITRILIEQARIG